MTAATRTHAALRVNDRYVLADAIASGATATVYVGRLTGPHGFGKTVAIKRLHPHLATSAEFRGILVEEARLAAQISHPNVAQVLEIVEANGEVFLVLEYVHGETLERLMALGGRPPVAVAAAIVRDVLRGLHAAHNARSAAGAPLELVHRDVNPRNVIVTTDGMAKLVDFGIARARGRNSTTGADTVRGTLPYMPPEQLHGERLTAQSDLYACAVVLWEALTGKRLFTAETESGITAKILDHDVTPPTGATPGLPAALDGVVLRGLAREPAARYASGLEMALALEQCVTPAAPVEIAAWVEATAHASLRARDAVLARAADTTSAAEAPAPPALAPAQASAAAAPARGRAARLPVALGVLAVAGIAIVARLTAGAPPPDAAAIASLPSAATMTATATAPPVVAAPPSDPVATVAFSALPVATAAPSPRPAPRPAATPSPAPAPAPSCSPYYVDDAGHRRFDRQCLQ